MDRPLLFRDLHVGTPIAPNAPRKDDDHCGGQRFRSGRQEVLVLTGVDKIRWTFSLLEDQVHLPGYASLVTLCGEEKGKKKKT